MKLTIKTKLMLFTLGAFYKIMNNRLKDKELVVAISKMDFINLILKTGIAQKQPRSIYKNLETLEINKYLTYDNKMLKFTPKGERKFKQIEKELLPYFKIIDTIKEQDVVKYASHAQTSFNF